MVIRNLSIKNNIKVHYYKDNTNNTVFEGGGQLFAFRMESWNVTQRKTRDDCTYSSRFTTVCFATIHNNDGFETRKSKNIKNCKKFKKCATINTGYDVKTHHSQSEMRAIPIYHLSQS